ncbi:MAG: Nif11 family protein [Atopobiaceae bacterium]|nr:Nif11 family protein [Atopobiaceae bacterium]
MNFSDLSPELLEKIKDCKSADELTALAADAGFELSDEFLQEIAGGKWSDELIQSAAGNLLSLSYVPCNINVPVTCPKATR